MAPAPRRTAAITTVLIGTLILLLPPYLTADTGTTRDRPADGRDIHFVVVPYFYDSLPAVQRDVEDGLAFWLETSPMRELEQPRDRIDITYIPPDAVDDPPEPTLCAATPFTDGLLRQADAHAATVDRPADRIIAVSAEPDHRRGGTMRGCTRITGNTVAVWGKSRTALAHELAHTFNMGHTSDYTGLTGDPGCGADRSTAETVARELLDEPFINDPQSDGRGEIMNYCSPDRYFSTDADQYSALKTALQDAGWM